MKQLGIIKSIDNELSNNDLDVSYSINIRSCGESLSVGGESLTVDGECSFGQSSRQPAVRFKFEYNKTEDLVKWQTPYRLSYCTHELYEKYYLNIRYSSSPPSTSFYKNTLYIPWFVMDTDSGIAIPQLIEYIMCRIPNVIVFETV